MLFDHYSIAHAGFVPGIFLIWLATRRSYDIVSNVKWGWVLFNALHLADELIENFSRYSLQSLHDWVVDGTSPVRDNPAYPINMIGDQLCCVIGTGLVGWFALVFYPPWQRQYDGFDIRRARGWRASVSRNALAVAVLCLHWCIVVCVRDSDNMSRSGSANGGISALAAVSIAAAHLSFTSLAVTAIKPMFAE